MFTLMLVSCKNNSETTSSNSETVTKSFDEIEQLKWLIGTWTNQEEGAFSQETWNQENDSTFTAYSFVEVKKKIVFAETMALEQIGEDLLLTVATADNKDEKPVTFKMISSEKGQVTFENKNHDFPKRITYTNPAKDSLHAWIEGVVNTEPKKVDFYFSKQK